MILRHHPAARDLRVRAGLAASGIAVAAAIVFGVVSAEPSPAVVATAVPEGAPAPAAATTEEPWVPGVMTFSGEREKRTTPLVLDDLDPNCTCAVSQ